MTEEKKIYGAIESLRLYLRDLYYFTKSAVTKSDDEIVYLCNSYPKSGTHLLAQILLKTNSVKYWNDIISVQSLSGRMNTLNHIKWKYKSVPGGSLVRSHLMCDLEIIKILDSRAHKRFFIYRDPRDVVCSHANWITKEPRIYLHDYYTNILATEEDRIMASIVGKPIGSPIGSNSSQPNIAVDFSRWSEWLNDSETLSIKFEDLVGERGGGDEVRRIDIIESIMKYINVSITRDELKCDYGSIAMDPKESHTFRKGQKGSIGSWRNKFTDLHKEQFKLLSGDLLQQLGYENDNNW